MQSSQLDFETRSFEDPLQVDLVTYSPLDIPLENNSVVELNMEGFMGYFSHFRWQLQEAWRVLAPGGTLTLCILNRKFHFLPNPIWIKSKLFGKIKRGSQKDYHFYSQDAFKSMLSELGFIVLAEDKRGLFETQYKLTKPNETFLEWSVRQLKNFYPEKFFAENMKSQKEMNPSAKDKINKYSEGTEIFTKELAGKNILILSPHPDDEIIGCGGMVIEGKKAGAKIRVIQLTDGAKSKSLQFFSDGEKKELRIVESKYVSEYLGFEMKAWAHPQESFFVKDRLIKKLQLELDDFSPHMIFVPSPQDSHPDHQIASKLLAEALAAQRETAPGIRVDVYGYEIWSLSDANTRLDITVSMEKKIGAIFKYKLAMRMENYVNRVLENNRYHAIKLNKPLGFAEGYQKLSPDAFIQMMLESPAVKMGEG